MQTSFQKVLLLAGDRSGARLDFTPGPMNNRSLKSLKGGTRKRVVTKRWLSFLVGCLLFEIGISQEMPATGEKQVVFVTGYGEIVLEVFPEKAPAHVDAFLKRIRDGDYVGTLFHRAIPFGIIQGGDPLSRESKNRDRYGTGGLSELNSEFNDVSHVRGTVSAVLVPGNPNSAGSQFFICVTDQVQLDGQYTAFGRVVEGMMVMERISQLPTDEKERIQERVEITRAFLRDRPPPLEIPFTRTPVLDLGRYRVSVETSLGDFELFFYPDQAPGHVRQFLCFSQLGLYNGTTFHRVIPGFVVQGGALSTRQNPVPEKYLPILRNLKAELNEQKHVRGTLSMARSDQLDSALDSFFIVLASQPSLDGQYTVFGYVSRGMDTIDGIAQVPVQGETPLVPVRITQMQVTEIEASRN